MRAKVAVCLLLFAPALVAWPAPADAKPLKRGARGERVIRLQQALKLPVDGVFGAATLRAVKRFQRTHDLAADGVVGRSKSVV